MKRRSFLHAASLGPAALLSASQARSSSAGPRPAGAEGVKTILSFATEAAHAPEDYDFIRDIARFLTEEKLVGNFHLTGDYARALKRLGRADVVEALLPHEIGFHCNHHGSKPWMAGYLEKLSWDEGLSRWLSYETPGVAVVEELLGRRPLYYTTEFAKAPQAIYGSALLGAAITGYSDVPMREHSAVWLCNSFIPSVENIVGLESFHAPGDREKAARERLDAGIQAQKAKGKDILRVFLHSYKYYAEPPYDRLTMTGEIYKNDEIYYEDYPQDYPRQPPAQFQRSFQMFQRAIRRHKQRSELVTFSRYRDAYKPIAGVWLSLSEVDELGRFLARSIDAYATARFSLSPAEAFGVVVRMLRRRSETGTFPERVFVRNLIGPRAEVVPVRADHVTSEKDLSAVLAALDRELDLSGVLPVTTDVAGVTVGPGQLLRGLVDLYNGARTGRSVESVACTGSNLPEIAREAYFQQNGFTRAGLYPVDFTGRNICALSRAQSWSWKPAVRVS